MQRDYESRSARHLADLPDAASVGRLAGERTVARLAPGGVLYFSNNFRRFRLDEAAVAAFARCEDISAATIPPDFARDPRIHRCWRLQRR